MSPAEHYAEAERLLALAEEIRHTADQRLLDEWAPGLSTVWAQRTAGRERVARTAQVHATLATVDPVKMARTKEVAFYSQHGQCSCPELAGAPFARTETAPDCPIHGGT